MSLILILTIITAVIIIALSVYNWITKVDESGDKQKEQIAAKKKWVNAGLYSSIASSILAVCATLYALPNVNKMISCPATA